MSIYVLIKYNKNNVTVSSALFVVYYVYTPTYLLILIRYKCYMNKYVTIKPLPTSFDTIMFVL